jgi:hypothetical protein
MATKRCKIHYRRLRRDNDQFPNVPLSRVIGSALQKTLPDGTKVGDTVKNRITAVPRQEEYRRLLNHHHIDDQYVFGDMCLFFPGQLQALLQLTAETEHKKIDEVLKALGDRILHGFAASKKILIDLLGEVGAQKIIDAMPTEAALEVRVNISYRATKRKIEKEFMSNIAAGLRNMAEGEIRVRGRDGEIKGEDARLSQDMIVKKVREASSLLDLEDALKQMLEVHRRFLYDGKILEHMK